MGQTAVPRRYWQLALDEISLSGAGSSVSLVVNDNKGSQMKVRYARFCGVSYDPTGDALDVGSGSLKHRIDHPKQIDLAHEGITISKLAVIGADDCRYVLSFNPPVSLGARD